jgi:hypothetical protein
MLACVKLDKYDRNFNLREKSAKTGERKPFYGVKI